MKYADIVELDKHFDPVFKLADGDKSAAWATFIPTVEPFEDLLRKTIDAFESQEPKAQRPVWVQGTYGTGKSHAASVISHLLDDGIGDLDSFLGRMKPELAARVRSFRETQRVAPVYLYGSGAPLVHSARTFDLAVQIAVKSGLKALGLRVGVPSDFDRFVDLIESNPFRMDWDSMIRESSQLRVYAPSGAKELLRRLRAQDREVLEALEDYFAETGNAYLGTTSLTTWLKEVLDNSLGGSSDYTGVMIYWDEFTSVLELTRARDIAAALQKLAEFCQAEPRLKLVIISHRKPGQFALDTDEQRKIDDRFKMVDYQMTDVTVYKILSAAIHRKDLPVYAALVSEAYSIHGELDSLVDRLDAGGAANMRDDIRGLFPIHPYTAYLATLISHHIGSSDRSIFMFLHDGEKGFKKFIADNPDGGQRWLTADTLWDYFAPTLATDEADEFLAVSTAFNQRQAIVEARGRNCTMAFKSMLLLNFLHAYLGHSDSLETSLVAPTCDNCEAMYAGTSLQGHAAEELAFLEEQGVLHKMGPEYLVMYGATLPEDEVRKEVDRLAGTYIDNITSVLDGGKKDELVGKYCGTSVLRDVRVNFFHGGPHATAFHRKAVDQLGFSDSTSLHVAVVLYAQDDDLVGAAEQLTDYSRRAMTTDPALVILEALLPIGSKKLQELASHRGHAAVAERHALANVKADYEKMANSIAANWAAQLGNSSQYNIYVKGRATSVGCTVLPAALQDCSEQIFKNGFDDVHHIPKTCWGGGGNKIAERVLQAESLDDLVHELAGQQKQVLGIFKSSSGSSYVVDQHLKQTEQAGQEPIGRLSRTVHEALEPMTKRVASFNLGDCLQDLAIAPYGLYENLLHSAALAFALRPYVNRFYDSNGRRIAVLPMRDMVEKLFRYWSGGKGRDSLEVQFGTETEEHLVQILKSIFGLSDVGTLMDARGQLRTWTDQRRRPLWSVKYMSVAPTVSSAVDALSALLRMTQTDIGESQMQRLVEELDPVSAELKLLLNENKLKTGFEQWLSQFITPAPTADSAEQIYGELSQKMAGSPSVWSEEAAHEKILAVLTPPVPPDTTASVTAAMVTEILGLTPSQDLAMVQLAAREVTRARKYPLFSAALSASTPAQQTAIESIRGFLQAPSVDRVDVDSLLKTIEDAGVKQVRDAVAPEVLELAFGTWVAHDLDVALSPKTTAAAYQSLLMGTSEPSMCKAEEARTALRECPPDIPPPEDFKERVRQSVMRRPASEAQKLLVQMADSTPNGWSTLGQLLGEEQDGQAHN
ncbi:MAG: DUF6079 family protein [Candidatus Cryosericum sp.]